MKGKPISARYLSSSVQLFSGFVFLFFDTKQTKAMNNGIQWKEGENW
jgi:hypothetical protein